MAWIPIFFIMGKDSQHNYPNSSLRRIVLRVGEWLHKKKGLTNPNNKKINDKFCIPDNMSKTNTSTMINKTKNLGR